MWRGTITLSDSIRLPFNFELSDNDSAFSITIFNGDEKVVVKDVRAAGDSFKMQMPVFANYIVAKVEGNRMNGYFVKPDARDYRLPFSADFGDTVRFKSSGKNCCDINKKWAVKFSPETEDETPAIAYFQQSGSRVTGTFLTETGDYRYLQGVLADDRLLLSAFDGNFLNYFDATVENGQMMAGIHYSGKSYSEKWVAYRDDDFQLRDADSLTYLREGYESFSFSFPDLKGREVSIEDAVFEDKPVIVQIMGSWCPNCMDESRFLTHLYNRYHKDGLEVVGLSFERTKDRETAFKRVRKMKQDLEIPYPVLLAGATRDDHASEALPMLNHVMSFPTTIFLDKDHKVVKIHTGFAGPGTPVFESFAVKTENIVKEMVQNSGEEEEKTEPGTKE